MQEFTEFKGLPETPEAVAEAEEWVERAMADPLCRLMGAIAEAAKTAVWWEYGAGLLAVCSDDDVIRALRTTEHGDSWARSYIERVSSVAYVQGVMDLPPSHPIAKLGIACLAPKIWRAHVAAWRPN